MASEKRIHTSDNDPTYCHGGDYHSEETSGMASHIRLGKLDANCEKASSEDYAHNLKSDVV
jgi:hypothetical protein